jgi:hypothetical protein
LPSASSDGRARHDANAATLKPFIFAFFSASKDKSSPVMTTRHHIRLYRVVEAKNANNDADINPQEAMHEAHHEYNPNNF